MRHCFVINPAAGRGKAAPGLRARIGRAFEGRGEPHEIHVTRAPGDAEEYVRAVCREGPGPVRFYACGGDGTLCEVANGAAGCPHASVAPYPCGSGNDFVRCFAEPGRFLWIEELLDAPARPVDLLRFSGGRYGVNMCNVGFDANVAFHMGKFKGWPLVSGGAAYSLALAYSLLQRMTHRLAVTVDGAETLEGEFLLTAIGNGRFCGGGYKAAPLALLADGRLDLCVVKRVSRATFLALVGAYREGRHLEDPALRSYVEFRRARSVEIVSDEPFAAGVDGEIGRMRRVRVEAAPGLLNLAAPESCWRAAALRAESAV